MLRGTVVSIEYRHSGPCRGDRGYSIGSALCTLLSAHRTISHFCHGLPFLSQALSSLSLWILVTASSATSYHPPFFILAACKSSSERLTIFLYRLFLPSSAILFHLHHPHHYFHRDRRGRRIRCVSLQNALRQVAASFRTSSAIPATNFSTSFTFVIAISAVCSKTSGPFSPYDVPYRIYQRP